MNDCFVVENNSINVLYEPLNDLDTFAKSCMEMLASSAEDNVYINFDPSVGAISSAYIGVLMSCAMLSKMVGKNLHIKCSERLKNLIIMLDGQKLMTLID